MKQFYFTTPVEVMKVTPKNLQEAAEWCGGRVAQVESRRFPGKMDSYVWVPTPATAAISWAFPGMYITRRLVFTMQGEMQQTWAVFRRDYFEKNYFETPDAAIEATWAQPAKKLAGLGPISEEDMMKEIRKGQKSFKKRNQKIRAEQKKPAEKLTADEAIEKVANGELTVKEAIEFTDVEKTLQRRIIQQTVNEPIRRDAAL